MAFNASNPVSVGDPTRKSDYDRAFDNTIALQDGSQALDSLTITGSLVINNDGGTDPIRFEGDSDQNLLYIDAQNDWVGIGTDGPAEEFRVDGIITYDQGLQERCILRLSSAQSISNNSWEDVDWDTEVITDNKDMHESVTNPERITFPVAGYYMIGFKLQWADDSTGDRGGKVLDDGSALLLSDTRLAQNSAESTASALAYFSANDWIKLQVYQNSGGALNLISGAAGAWFWATRVA
jgi:hypothetical protein